MPMPVADRQSRRAVSGVRLALLVAALVAAAIAVVWMAGPWATETPSTDPERPPPEPTAVGSVPSAAATLAGIAAIREDFTRQCRPVIASWTVQRASRSKPGSPSWRLCRRPRTATTSPGCSTSVSPCSIPKPPSTTPCWARPNPCGSRPSSEPGEFDHAAALMRASNLHPSARLAASRALLRLGGSETELRAVAQRLGRERGPRPLPPFAGG